MLLGNSDTDQTWEYFGKHDPYFGVLVEDEFKRANLTSSSKERFFQTGFDQIEAVFEMVRDHVDASFCPRSALDFGCGVGRLVVPLARQSATVLGVDISDSMLEEARLNCEAYGISNAYFAKADDNLSLVSKKFDLIHSPRRDERLRRPVPACFAAARPNRKT